VKSLAIGRSPPGSAVKIRVLVWIRRARTSSGHRFFPLLVPDCAINHLNYGKEKNTSWQRRLSYTRCYGTWLGRLILYIEVSNEWVIFGYIWKYNSSCIVSTVYEAWRYEGHFWFLGRGIVFWNHWRPYWCLWGREISSISRLR